MVSTLLETENLWGVHFLLVVVRERLIRKTTTKFLQSKQSAQFSLIFELRIKIIGIRNDDQINNQVTNNFCNCILRLAIKAKL